MPDTAFYKMVSKPVESIQMKCEECEEEEKIQMKPEDRFSLAGGADEGQKQKTQDQSESLQLAPNDSISSESNGHNGVASMSSQAKQMSPEPSPDLQMKCEECEEKERVQMKPEVIRKAMAGANGEDEEDDPTSVQDKLKGATEPQIANNDSNTVQMKSLETKLQLQLKETNVPAPTIQPKLKIGQPGDKYEREADAVADRVMRMSDTDAMQMQAVEEEEETLQPKIRMQPVEEEEPIQTKSIDKQSSPVTTGLQNKIQSLKGGGQPLPKSARAFLEPRFGADFSSVRVYSDSSAAHISRSINARAFTHGHDVVFGAGQYSPETSAGKKLISHELTHVVQQEGRSQVGISSKAPLSVQRKPSQVRAHRFLGLNINGGVNPTLASRLNNVAARLRREYQTVHGTPAANDTVVRNWAGIYSMRSWRQRIPRPGRRPSRSKHCSGSAVDVNYDNQPYIVTRSMVRGREVLGGESAGRRLTAQRQATVDVFDRAKEFVFGPLKIVIPIPTIIPFRFIPITISLPNRADVSQRRTGESTGDVFDRFKQTSNALGTYLGLVFHTAPNAVRRRPIRNIERASEAALRRAIPTTERKTEAVGIAAIQSYIRAHLTSAGNGPAFHFSIGDIGRARDFYFRMLRDYEHVRIPMVRGNPVARPGNTRNPARGFLDMSREFVVAMADVGRLRWGIADLGAAESGDTHHFDLGNHGGVRPDCLP